METMKAFWRYDWALNRGRLITIVVIAALWPWAMAVSQRGLRAGDEWALYASVFSSFIILAIPGIMVGYLSDLGRNGAPFDFRHFSRTVPICPGRWALAKVVSVLVWGVAVPAILLVGMICAAAYSLHKPETAVAPALARHGLAVLSVLGVVAAGKVWSMLCATLMPRGQSNGAAALLGGAVFVGAELLVHEVTGILALGKAMGRIRGPWESVGEIGLCLLLAVALSLVFIRYHQSRRTWQAVGLAVVALAAVDGARALLWW